MAPPEDVIGKPGEPLFPSQPEASLRPKAPRLDKNRKGIIELVIAFMAIAVITLTITAFVLEGSFVPWIPIGSVILGGLYLLVALFIRITYAKIMTWYSFLTILLIMMIDLDDGQLSWALPTMLSLVLFWLTAVFPWLLHTHQRRVGWIVGLVSIAFYLIALDGLLTGSIDWSLSIALPTYGVVLLSLSFLVLRIHYGHPTVTDIVLSIILSACWGVVAGDFFHLRSIGSGQLLSWSASVAIVAICLLILLTSMVSVRRVRNYFNNRVS
jgi:hypothetical protein